MFVPDDAKKRRIKDELTPAAWFVYEAHCERRYNHRHKNKRLRGLSFATRQEIAEGEGIALKTVQNAYTELRRKGWIEELPDGSVRPLVGDFSPVDKAKRQTPEARDPHPESGTLFPDLGNRRPDLGKDDPELGTGRPDLGNGAYKGSRARILQPSPATSSTHTPARPAGDVAGGAPPVGGGVCVSISKSRYEFEQVHEWAKGQRAEGAQIDPYAVARARWRDGTADADVERFLARREQVQEGKRPVEQQLTPYHVAAQAVASVAQVPKYDVAGFIAQMQGVSEETRERLRSTFVPEQARAHAPP